MALPVFTVAVGSTLAGSGSLGTCTSLPVTTGRFLIVGLTQYNAGTNISAVTDTVGNTFMKAGTTQGGDANQDNEVWYTPNPVVGTTTDTVIVRYSTNTAAFRDITVCEFSWNGASTISFHAEALHNLASTSAINALVSLTLSSTAEGLIIGNFVAYDAGGPLSSTATGTIMVGVPTSAAEDQVTAYRLLTAAGLTTIQIAGAVNRYSIVAKSFYAVAAGTTTPATALNITLPLLGAGQG